MAYFWNLEISQCLIGLVLNLKNEKIFGKYNHWTKLPPFFDIFIKVLICLVQTSKDFKTFVWNITKSKNVNKNRWQFFYRYSLRYAGNDTAFWSYCLIMPKRFSKHKANSTQLKILKLWDIVISFLHRNRKSCSRFLFHNILTFDDDLREGI